MSASASSLEITVFVDDDGLPILTPGSGNTGMSMGLAKWMMASIDGPLITPSGESKVFELRVPIGN